MFLDFFYTLRAKGAPASTGEYLDFLKAIESLCADGAPPDMDTFYHIARTTLVKDVKYYDAFDLGFAECFEGVVSDEDFKNKLKSWLEKAKENELSEERKAQAPNLPSEELLKELQKRMDEQKERHDGGHKWIGTGGISPFGHSGHNPAGVRIGGSSGSRSALAVAGKREFKEYRDDEKLDVRNLKVALKKLRALKKTGRKKLDIDASIKRTCENMGEIEIVESAQRKNSLRLVLLMDVGGSMTPHSKRVEKLFSAAHQTNHFKSFDSYYFHNIFYDKVYKGAEMDSRKSVRIDDLKKTYPVDTRFLIVGDAYMAPYELFQMTGSMREFYFNLRNAGGSAKTGIDRVRQLKGLFPNTVWLNPEGEALWSSPSISAVRSQVPMFEMTLAGIDKAVKELSRNL